MKITIQRLGSSQKLELGVGTTVGEVLLHQGYYPGQEVSVHMVRETSMEEVFPDHELLDGDTLFIATPITGAAPLPPGYKPEGVARLMNFTKGALELILIDPYALTPGKHSETGHVATLSDCVQLGAGTLKRLSIVYSWWNPNSQVQKVISLLEGKCKQFGCEFAHKRDTTIHDRVWIKDRKQGLLVGTSVNSIGGRLAFAVPLPREDLDYLLDYLSRRKLV